MQPISTSVLYTVFIFPLAFLYEVDGLVFIVSIILVFYFHFHFTNITFFLHCLWEFLINQTIGTPIPLSMHNMGPFHLYLCIASAGHVKFLVKFGFTVLPT